MRADLGNGLLIRDATDEDVRRVHARLRAGDRAEHAFDEDNADTAGNMPGVSVVVKDGELIGYIGSLPPPNENVWSPRRVVYYLSTDAVDRHRLEYVRRTPEVFKAVVDEMPEWVSEILTVSMPEAYPMACKWLERTLGFEALADFAWRGGKHRLYRKHRKDI